MEINFKQGDVSLHKILPEGSTRFIAADTEEEIAEHYLSMIRISNEAMDDEGDEWRRCKECGQWKPLDQMTGVVYLSYPGQYDCKECAKNLFNKKPEIKVIKPACTDKDLEVLPYKGKIKDKPGVIFCPFKGDKNV